MTTVRKMRIHRFGGPEVLELEEIEPSLPDAAQILVRTKAASVNPVDFKIRNGKYPAVKEDRLPYTLGRDVSRRGRVLRRAGDQIQGRRRRFRDGRNRGRRLCRKGRPGSMGDRS
jgi:NADPH:quinone reductase-like Zn-dependent oxidoreductase